MEKKYEFIITGETAFFIPFLVDLFLGSSLEGNFSLIYRLIMSFVLAGLISFMMFFLFNDEKKNKKSGGRRIENEN